MRPWWEVVREVASSVVIDVGSGVARIRRLLDAIKVMREMRYGLSPT